MRVQQTPPLALGRQLAEWRRPIDTDPAVDDAVMRMLRALKRHVQRQPEPQDAKG